LTICRYSSLIFWEGLNHLLLDQPSQAERIFERIDGFQSDPYTPERNRVEVLNYQVATFLAQRKMDEACTYLEAAATAATALRSVRRIQEANTLLLQMDSWPLRGLTTRLPCTQRELTRNDRVFSMIIR
jgi:hypothetical protein